MVIRISFEGLGEKAFSSENEFCESFINLVTDELLYNAVEEIVVSEWEENKSNLTKFEELSKKITQLITGASKEVILMVDEVDKSSDNQLFLHFIGMLRTKYLKRNEGRDKTFKSVILAGVYDIKNLKLKIASNEERKYNSPWNIAANFTVEMSFNPKEISTMLIEYQKDTKTVMDIDTVSQIIYEYTNGYPFLVSRLCKSIEEDLNRDWSEQGIRNAVKLVLEENNTLFDDIIKNLENNLDMYNVIYGLIIEGKEFSYNIANPTLAKLLMFSIIDRNNEEIKMHNQIFEKFSYNYLISKIETSGKK